jgi:hypothetical protein
MLSFIDTGEGICDLQACFSTQLKQRGAAAPAGLIRPKRFRVYRNTFFATLIDALRARYPVTERLVGEEFFNAAAALFIEAQPPSSPVLIDYGEGFSAFLGSFEPACTVPYLADVARLEWFRHRAYHAADANALQPSDLASAPPDRVSALTFEFHPSVSLIFSPYPIVSICESNAHDAETRKIGPDLPEEAALIVRSGYDTLVVRLGEAEYAFAASLAKGATLAEAAARGAEHPGFDLAAALANLIAAGAFCNFTFSSSEIGDAHHA